MGVSPRHSCSRPVASGSQCSLSRSCRSCHRRRDTRRHSTGGVAGHVHVTRTAFVALAVAAAAELAAGAGVASAGAAAVGVAAAAGVAPVRGVAGARIARAVGRRRAAPVAEHRSPSSSSRWWYRPGSRRRRRSPARTSSRSRCDSRLLDTGAEAEIDVQEVHAGRASRTGTAGRTFGRAVAAWPGGIGLVLRARHQPLAAQS